MANAKITESKAGAGVDTVYNSETGQVEPAKKQMEPIAEEWDHKMRVQEALEGGGEVKVRTDQAMLTSGYWVRLYS